MALEEEVMAPRRVRADARRNLEALVEAAAEVFAAAGVDAPAREIAVRAGVGVGTLYRHYPKRSDLVAAVFRHQVDACADAAPVLAAEHAPGDALDRWLARFVDFLASKRGLAAALHSGEPAFDALPSYFDERFRPALAHLLSAAVAAGEACDDVPAGDLLHAVAHLCLPAEGAAPDHARRMTALLVRGLRPGPQGHQVVGQPDDGVTSANSASNASHSDGENSARYRDASGWPAH